MFFLGAFWGAFFHYEWYGKGANSGQISLLYESIGAVLCIPIYITVSSLCNMNASLFSTMSIYVVSVVDVLDECIAVLQ